MDAQGIARSETDSLESPLASLTRSPAISPLEANFRKVKGSTEQNKAIVILGNYSANINMLVLTLEKASHSYPDIFWEKEYVSIRGLIIFWF